MPRRLPRLISLTGPNAGEEAIVKGDRFVIGREVGCGLRIQDAVISPRHAEIFSGPDGRLRLRDLGSRNGSRVHNSRVDQELHDNDEHVLQRKDRIFFACHEFIYDDGRGVLTPTRILARVSWVTVLLAVLVYAILSIRPQFRKPDEVFRSHLAAGRSVEARQVLDAQATSEWSEKHKEQFAAMNRLMDAIELWNKIANELNLGRWDDASEKVRQLMLKQEDEEMWRELPSDNRVRDQIQEVRDLLIAYRSARDLDAMAADEDTRSKSFALDLAIRQIKTPESPTMKSLLGAAKERNNTLTNLLARMRRYDFLDELNQSNEHRLSIIATNFAKLRLSVDQLPKDSPAYQRSLTELNRVQTAVSNLLLTADALTSGGRIYFDNDDTNLVPSITRYWNTLRKLAEDRKRTGVENRPKSP